MVVGMRKRKSGAAIKQIMKETDWQPHTCRGSLAGTAKKRLGLKVVSEKPESGDPVNRIAWAAR